MVERATLRAVAQHAGVSVATASRALNSARPVAPATRAKVRAAVDALGYVGDPRRQGPRPMLGVVVPQMSHQVNSEVIAGVEEATADAGRFCVFTVSRNDPCRELDQLAELVDDERIGGVILAGGFQLTAEYARRFVRVTREARDAGKPIVLCGRAMTASRELVVTGVTVLEYDNEGGAASAVGLLASRGHRRIALVRGPLGHSTSDARSVGWSQGLDRFGLEPDPDLVRTGPRDASHGRAAGADLLSRHPDVTAIFAESDELAMGVLQAAHLAGRPVPSSLSVIGFDDQHNASYFVPPLTTVHMPFAELGRRAARIALDLDPVHPGQDRLMVGTHLTIRESVSEPPRRP